MSEENKTEPTREELLAACKTEMEAVKAIASRLAELVAVYKTKESYAMEETAALGALLFSVYNGLERVMENVLSFDALQIKSHEERHAEVLRKTFELGVLPQDLFNSLSKYLAFRRFFESSYVTELSAHKLAELAETLPPTLAGFEKEVCEYIETV
ncbi:MAG: hypothetical protein M0Z52_12070 [Actinomycetota bacterium]|nr:hypothetical protein [Nitrospiraceae bacterium]MDA8157165.1 hypothetical protein [Actinomycetota bacterium]